MDDNVPRLLPLLPLVRQTASDNRQLWALLGYARQQDAQQHAQQHAQQDAKLDNTDEVIVEDKSVPSIFSRHLWLSGK